MIPEHWIKSVYEHCIICPQNKKNTHLTLAFIQLPIITIIKSDLLMKIDIFIFFSMYLCLFTYFILQIELSVYVTKFALSGSLPFSQSDLSLNELPKTFNYVADIFMVSVT